MRKVWVSETAMPDGTVRRAHWRRAASLGRPDRLPDSSVGEQLAEQQPFGPMSDVRHRDDATLYHGSSRSFEVGDVILPRSKSVAHATRSVRTAKVFADGAGFVYQVVPLDESKAWSRQMKHTGDEFHEETLSEEGFRVVAVLGCASEVESEPLEEGQRECDSCGTVTDGGSEWPNGECEDCDPDGTDSARAEFEQDF